MVCPAHRSQMSRISRSGESGLRSIPGSVASAARRACGAGAIRVVAVSSAELWVSIDQPRTMTRRRLRSKMSLVAIPGSITTFSICTSAPAPARESWQPPTTPRRACLWHYPRWPSSRGREDVRAIAKEINGIGNACNLPVQQPTLEIEVNLAQRNATASNRR